jgi:hypothetical protein
MPMRRLVVTGKDTPENLSLFFGPNAASIEDIHQSTRIEALLEPPRGSPMYAHLTGMNLDKNCPPWTLRGPSPVETQKVKEVKDMQEIIRRHSTYILTKLRNCSPCIFC